MLGSEIESVVQAWDYDVIHYGNYSLPKPEDAKPIDRASADRFTIPITEIARRAGVSIGVIDRYRDRPTIRVPGYLLYVFGSKLFYAKDCRTRTYRVHDLRNNWYGKGYAQKYLLSLLIQQEDMFKIPPTDSRLVIALFAPSNTINARNDWKKLLRNRYYVIAIPYRRTGDDDIWDDKYSDYTYTSNELPPFLDIPKYVMLHRDRREAAYGMNMICDPASRWAVVADDIMYQDHQIPPFNVTEWSKVLGVMMRTRLSHNNDTLHKIRRYVATLHGYSDINGHIIDHNGNTVEPAGHLINIFLSSHIVPIDINGYGHMITQNRRGAKPNNKVFEEEKHKTVWHTDVEWLLGYKTYVRMAIAFGWKPKQLPHTLTWMDSITIVPDADAC
jgi:hypothetical protein